MYQIMLLKEIYFMEWINKYMILLLHMEYYATRLAVS